MAPTASFETVIRVRPLKVVALLCSLLAVFLMIISLAPSYWLVTDVYREGLFERCKLTGNDTSMECVAIDPPQAWSQACAALMIITMLITLAASIITGMALCSKEPNRKYTLYFIAMCAMFFGVLLLVIALIVYPVMFWEDLENKVKQGGHEWQFDWAYGLGWGAVVFLLGAGILLYFERHSEEVDYMEKQHMITEEGRQMHDRERLLYKGQVITSC